jgi:glycosyltransferase involved in cell wall biosynthesis
LKLKGQETLLKALPIVEQHFPSVTVWLVGEGEHRSALEQMSRSFKLQTHVKFLGLRSDVKRLLQMADLFVFPTLYEAFGIVLVEAMAAGLPCIASRTEAILEIVEDDYSGLTFSPGSSEELAERIIELARDPDRCKRMGERAKQIAQERFDARVAAAAYERIYLAAFEEQVLSVEGGGFF